MSADEDRIWLEALAGRADESEPSAEAQEARALRELIHGQSLDDSTTVAAVDPAREEHLIERARTAGLLPARPNPAHPAASSAPWRRWLFAPRGLLAVAALATIAIAVLVQALLPPAETFRGVAGGTVRLESRNPPALKRQLMEELDAAGVRASGYDRLGRAGIDADLPQPVSAQVRRVLERHRIPIPADGILVVEIDAPSDR
jgi:hypothetical protein